MTENEFRTQMTRLIETFGKAPYGTERVKLLWNEVSDMPDYYFEKCVSSWIGAMRQAPLLGEFRDAAATAKRTSQAPQALSEPEWEQKKEYKCEYCKDNGTYLCTRKDHEGFWGFRCHCPAGLADIRTAIPHFKPAHSHEYKFYESANRNYLVTP